MAENFYTHCFKKKRINLLTFSDVITLASKSKTIHAHSNEMLNKILNWKNPVKYQIGKCDQILPFSNFFETHLKPYQTT